MRTVDLDTLIASVADDLADLGNELAVPDSSRVRVACLPVALHCTSRNLLENAGARCPGNGGSRATTDVCSSRGSTESQSWWSDSNNSVSGKPGAVQPATRLHPGVSSSKHHHSDDPLDQIGD